MEYRRARELIISLGALFPPPRRRRSQNFCRTFECFFISLYLEVKGEAEEGGGKREDVGEEKKKKEQEEEEEGGWEGEWKRE